MMQILGVDAISGEDCTLTGGAVVQIAPLSFWGGLDSATGQITDQSHPSYGVVLAQQIVAMTHARGSSSSSSVLAECLRLGTAPKALILAVADPIILVAALVALELYGVQMPVLILPSFFKASEQT